MKKKYLLLILLISIIENVNAQFLTQSAEGKGAVLLPLQGVSVGFDFGKTELTVGANNYARSLRTNNSKLFQNWFVGGNLAVGNSSGIGNLFKSGDIVGGGNLQGFLGFNINNNQKILDKWDTGKVKILSQMENEKLAQLFRAYRADITTYIIASLQEIDEDDFRKSKGEELIKLVSEATDAYSLRNKIVTIRTNQDPKLKEFIIAFRSLQEPREKIYTLSYSMSATTKSIDSAFNHFVDNNLVKRFTSFLFGGIDARNFSVYTGLNSSSLAASFKDTLYRGGQIGLGINAQLGSFWLGITYSYLASDNFSNLSAKEYTLRTTDTSRNQSLISEKKITGYSGKYGYVDCNQLNIDLTKEFKLSDTSRLITNLYYRGTVYSRDTAYLKNISNIGLGLYFLGNKSKFIGGLYIELPDINNNIEKAKPESERNIRPTLKKLTFGVTARFSISSIFGFSNRPRKPD